jgi:hypothetical protein
MSKYKGMKVLETGMIEDSEKHGAEGLHTSLFLDIYARNTADISLHLSRGE